MKKNEEFTVIHVKKNFVKSNYIITLLQNFAEDVNFTKVFLKTVKRVLNF